MDKNKSLQTFITSYPQLYSWLYFNTIISLPGNVALLTDADNLVEEYVDGSKLREYVFAVTFSRSYDTGTSDINADAMAEAERFGDWIAEQSYQENFPEWGSNISIQEMLVLTKIPLMTVDTESQTAQYMMQLKINYLEMED